MWGMAKKKSAGEIDRVRLMDNLRVVLVEARNPLNIGAAARAMSNFGVRAVAGGESLRSGVSRGAVGGGRGGLASEGRSSLTTSATAVADCRLVVGTSAVGPRELQHPLKRLEAGGREIRRGVGGGSGGAAVRLGAVRTVES